MNEFVLHHPNPHLQCVPPHPPTGHFATPQRFVSHHARRDFFLFINFFKIYLNLLLICSLCLLLQPPHDLFLLPPGMGSELQLQVEAVLNYTPSLLIAGWCVCSEDNVYMEFIFPFLSPYLFFLEFSRGSNQHLPPGVCSALIILPLVQAEVCSHSCPREQGLTGAGPFW